MKLSVKGLNPANVIQTLQFSVDGGLPELKTFATKYIAENRRVIMADTTTKLQLKQFPDVMLEIVESMGWTRRRARSGLVIRRFNIKHFCW